MFGDRQMSESPILVKMLEYTQSNLAQTTIPSQLETERKWLHPQFENQSNDL